MVETFVNDEMTASDTDVWREESSAPLLKQLQEVYGYDHVRVRELTVHEEQQMRKFKNSHGKLVILIEI